MSIDKLFYVGIHMTPVHTIYCISDISRKFRLYRTRVCKYLLKKRYLLVPPAELNGKTIFLAKPTLIWGRATLSG